MNQLSLTHLLGGKDLVTSTTANAITDEQVQAASSVCVGQVGAPTRQEATSSEFYFWVPADAKVERTQLVTCESTIAGRLYKFYGIVNEVYRSDRKRTMGNVIDEADSNIDYVPPFESAGFTYAHATILRVDPPALLAPRERSKVLLASDGDAALAYGADEITNQLSVGLIKNGGTDLVGQGVIDLDYLLGMNGGHMNVNGSAGRGTKSSFLLFVLHQLLAWARKWAQARPSDPRRPTIVPIIFNVKNFDLLVIDQRNRRYEPERHAATWNALGVQDPQPFTGATFYAPQQRKQETPVPTGRTGSVQPYSWSLSDVIEQGLFPYLFAEADANEANFAALILDLENWLTDEKAATDGSTEVKLSLRVGDDLPTTFDALLAWSRDENKVKSHLGGSHHDGTIRKFNRRLTKLLYEGDGVLRRSDHKGNPLQLVRTQTCDPLVVDLSALATAPELQRFVVATILRQLIDARTGLKRMEGLVYVVVLDELNRFAPRGAKDAITALIELVAAEMRSQGIILLGAQQQASRVSEKVIENAAIRVLGRTGSLELNMPPWRFLSDSAQAKAQTLRLDEKLIIQDNFTEPMHVQVPFPVWAMNQSEAASSDLGAGMANPGRYDDLLDNDE